MSDDEFRRGLESVHRLIWKKITAGAPGAGSDVTWEFPRRQALTSPEAFNAIFAKRDQHKPVQWAIPIPNPSTDALLDNAPVAAFAGAFLGCLTTLNLSAFGLAPGIASALATVLLCGQLVIARTTGLFADAFFPALYGGTFAGMTPILWLSDSASGHSAALTSVLFIVLSIACGLAFFVVAKFDACRATPIAWGYGGRLGAIATVASFLFIELVTLSGTDTGRFYELAAGVSRVEPRLALEFLAGLLGIAATMSALRQPRVASAGVAGRTLIASTVALAGLVTLHFCSPNDVPTSDAFYAGCFLGMSTAERLKGWFAPVLSALVLVVVLVPVHAALPGIGGGLGFAAFVTLALLEALSHATTWMAEQILTPTGSLATTNEARSRDLDHRQPALLAPPRGDHAQIDGIGRSLVSRWGERKVAPEPRGSSRLATLALGVAIANAPIAVFLVTHWWLPHGKAAAPELLAEEVRGTIVTTAAPGAGQSPTILPQLVIRKSLPGSVDQLIPLGISLVNAADDDVVVLSGLPAGSSVTNGRLSATREWHLPANELVDAAIRPAQGFVGGTDVAVELRRAAQTVDRGIQHLEWTDAVPAATAAVPAATAEVATAAVVGPSSDKPSADETAENHEALFREFLAYVNHARPETHRPWTPGNTARLHRAGRTGGANMTSAEAARPPASRKRREMN
jgi:hypothetical protein